jgi:hypothetical protein
LAGRFFAFFAGFHYDHFHDGRFYQRFFFAGVSPGFSDWTYDDYGSCRMLAAYGWQLASGEDPGDRFGSHV